MNASSTPPEPAPDLPFPLQEGERVTALFRRHWIYLWPHVALYAVLALAPVVVLWVVLDTSGAFDGIVTTIFWIAAAVYIVYWLVRTFLLWYRYNHDIWVVTTQRLIDSYRTNPFSLRVVTADLVNVQDLTVERRGILPTMLDYGDIICKTASQQEDFRLGGLPDPRAVQALVDRERDRERQGAETRLERVDPKN